MTWLVITEDDGTERVVELGAGSLRIGRGAGNDIVLPDARKGVSRAHAELRFEDGHYVIVDLQSQNGTWLNGQRVQRAEVPPDGEITLGTYRLRRRDGARPDPGPPKTASLPAEAPAAASVPAQRTPSAGTGPASDAAWPEVVISRPETRGRERAPQAESRTGGSGLVFAALVVAALLVVAVTIWRFAGGSQSEPTGSDGTAATPAPASSPPPQAAAPPPAPPPAPVPATAASESASAPETPAGPPPVIRRTTPVSRTALPPVPRRPNESVDGWRNRIAALEARYDYSKAALERGDFGSAASGFDAILREEPGFLDAPALLVQARAGLRAAALDVLAAGNRLDAAGDWFGALQQYERAREVDSGTPGVDAAVKRVREKLRQAGQAAFELGREHERAGRLAAALQEYEKAVQWLPADDPTREAVRSRIEQLRISARD